MKKDDKDRDKYRASTAFEIFTNDIAMTAKMSCKIAKCAALLQIVLLAVVAYCFRSEIYWLWTFALAKISINGDTIMSVRDGRGGYIDAPARHVVQVLVPYLAGYISRLAPWAWATFAVYPVGLVGGFLFFGTQARKELAPRHERGTELAPVVEIAAKMKAQKIATRLSLGAVLRQPVELENRHLLVCAQQGWGKTMIEIARMAAIRKIGGRAVVYCYKVDDLFRRFYDPKTDKIFAPLDARCVGFNIFAQIHATDPIRAKMDIKAIAKSLIPTPIDAGQNSWCYDNAADLFAAILWYLWKRKKRTNRHVWKMIREAGIDLKSFAEKLKGTEGCEAAHSHIIHEKTGATVLSTLNTSAQAFEFLAAVDGDFSVAEWMQSDELGVLWVLNPEESKAVMRDMLTLFIDLTIRALAATPDDRNRRRYFLLGELATLHRLDSINVLLTECRSKGACTDISFQSLPQLEAVYSPRIAEHIWGQCATKVYGRCTDVRTSEYMARSIGEAETTEASTATTWGKNDGRDGGSRHDQHRKKAAVMAEEIRVLPDLQGYVYLQGYGWTLTTVPVSDFPAVCDAFVPRPVAPAQKAMAAETKEETAENEVADLDIY